jgi:hypothetical protein
MRTPEPGLERYAPRRERKRVRRWRCLVREALQQLRDGRRRAFPVNDEPQPRADVVRVVGDLAERQVGEHVGPQHGE